MISALRHLFAAAAVVACAGAYASGGGTTWDPYVNRDAPDIALSRYQSGELGVVVNSYDRLYLYTAWRSVMLGAEGVKKAPNPDGGLLRALGARDGGWTGSTQSANAYRVWEDAIANALHQAPLKAKDGNGLGYGYVQCPLASYAFATDTLNGLAKRDDATPARLAAWVASQRQVFKVCGDDPTSTRPPYSSEKPVIAAPPELPASEALYWRQMQQYHLASFAFYNNDYERAAALFGAIGATDKHPLRQWGEYLALRAQARAADYVPEDERWKQMQAMRQEGPQEAAARQAVQQKKLAAIQASIAHILAKPELASLHEASRAIGRSMQVRLTPALRFAELGKLLDDPRANPYLDDHLGDWRVLARSELEAPGRNQADKRDAVRAQAGFVDWIQTIGQCREFEAQRDCAVERQHALEIWRRYVKEDNKPQARAWLLASVLMSDRLTAEQEQAASQVAASAPEYLTMRHALARHYRLTGAADKARAIADAVLASPALAAASSTSARNLFLQERFALATSPADAAKYLMRAHSRNLDPDTGEQVKKEEAQIDIAADGQRWLNSGLSAADIQTVAAEPSLPATWRARIAVAAWLRFDLLGRQDAALTAAKLAEQSAPELAPAVQAYRNQPAAPERHYTLLVNALKYGMSPVFQSYAQPPQLRAADDTLADMWCKLPAKTGDSYNENVDAEFSLPTPQLGDIATRDKELAQLGALKTATGYIGEAVLARVKATPTDPDLPWLLYVTVQSTRGGCLDGDAKTLSRNAFSVLHKRYGKSEWATKTPYYY
ncbi:hypothetical protein GJ699_18480 [Duganella sp. FT80W]|uniref:Tetratricopeptide repeat protein n=1 Tax=Duganella guangzhouensis TaxID=2666084 RepID=A0A6I2L245_9BURK|nr:hypothetical protein [Duganella guangzhouensis]MRW91983.1 hypothetical protein [Duganella guangzhouensis]